MSLFENVSEEKLNAFLEEAVEEAEYEYEYKNGAKYVARTLAYQGTDLIMNRAIGSIKGMSFMQPGEQMNTCTAGVTNQKRCCDYRKSSVSDRCMYFTFDEFCTRR